MSDTILTPQFRGSRFRRPFTLGNGWTSAVITEMRWTLRDKVPPTEITDDANIIAKATLTGGEISFSTTTDGTIEISSGVTNNWPVGTFHFDFELEIASGEVEIIDKGTLQIKGDVSRVSSI